VICDIKAPQGVNGETLRAAEGCSGACAVGAADGRASSAAATSNSVNAAARQIHGAHKIVEVIRHVQAARRVDRHVDWPVKRRSSSGAVSAPTSYAARATGERRDAA
jgi:hypothetical protein